MTCSGRPVNLEVLLGENASGTVYVRIQLKRPEWLGRSFILGKFTLARETFEPKKFLWLV